MEGTGLPPQGQANGEPQRMCEQERVQEGSGQKAPSPIAGPELAERKPVARQLVAPSNGWAPFLSPPQLGLLLLALLS